MRTLHIGRSALAVTDEVADSWAEIAARAERESAAHGGRTVVYARTDEHGFVLIPIVPEAPVTFADDEEAGPRERGVITAASADRGQITSAIAAERGPEPEPTDAEVAALVQELKEDRPDLDWDNLLSGRLAGPVTPDRPDVPVWDYLAFVKRHPETRLADLTSARFPVRYLDGSWSVTSVDEDLRPVPSSYKGTLPEPAVTETAHTVISRYAALHDAGVIEWDPVERGVVHLKPIGSYTAVVHAWIRSLDPPS
jgi:hypothetical protein